MFVVASLVDEWWFMLTVVDDLLVVCDRLEGEEMLALSLLHHNRTGFGLVSVPLCLLAIKLTPVVDVRLALGSSEMGARQID